MPNLDINEYQAKQIILNHWDSNLTLKTKSVKADKNTKLSDLDNLSNDLVLKPDMLFGKRFKNNLVFIGLNKKQVIQKIKYLSNVQTKLISGHKGVLSNYIVEDNVKFYDMNEYYLSIEMQSDGDKISFSKKGGINVEENFDSIRVVTVNSVDEKILLSTDKNINSFIKAIYSIFCKSGMLEIELNPFLVNDNDVYLLDCVAKIDSYALTTNCILKNIKIDPISFGDKNKSIQESQVVLLDKNSGSSLKLSILNNNGTIWGLYSGGGASLALIDTITDLCGYSNIANYGEYSGNPTFNEVYEYCNIILNAISLTNHNQCNYLVIAGAIANFTNVQITLEAIAKSLKDNIHSVDYTSVKIYLRRGGPNYYEGIQAIIDTCEELNIPLIAYGPEVGLCKIVEDLKFEM